jgi:hypothetical protein
MSRTERTCPENWTLYVYVTPSRCGKLSRMSSQQQLCLQTRMEKEKMKKEKGSSKRKDSILSTSIYLYGYMG